MPISIILGFLPWIVFDLLPKITHQQMMHAVAFALITTIAANYKDIKKLYILPCATLVFFVSTSLTLLFFDLPWLHANIWVATNLMCSLIAWGSLAIKQPFTLQYAKESVTKEHWTHPLFVRINNLLTTLWGIIFILHLSVNIFKTKLSYLNPPISIILNTATTVFGVWFCTWFPNWYPQYLKTKNNLENEHESTGN